MVDLRSTKNLSRLHDQGDQIWKFSPNRADFKAEWQFFIEVNSPKKSPFLGEF
jgi:hypothetical protein